MMGEIRSHGHGKKNDPDLPSKKKLPHDGLKSCLKKVWGKLESLKKRSDPRPNTLKRSYKWPPTHLAPVQKVNIALIKFDIKNQGFLKKIKAFSRL